MIVTKRMRRMVVALVGKVALGTGVAMAEQVYPQNTVAHVPAHGRLIVSAACHEDEGDAAIFSGAGFKNAFTGKWMRWPQAQGVVARVPILDHNSDAMLGFEFSVFNNATVPVDFVAYTTCLHGE